MAKTNEITRQEISYFLETKLKSEPGDITGANDRKVWLSDVVEAVYEFIKHA